MFIVILFCFGLYQEKEVEERKKHLTSPFVLEGVPYYPRHREQGQTDDEGIVVPLYLLLLLLVDSLQFDDLVLFRLLVYLHLYIGIYQESVSIRRQVKKTSTNVTQNGWVFLPNIGGS